MRACRLNHPHHRNQGRSPPGIGNSHLQQAFDRGRVSGVSPNSLGVYAGDSRPPITLHLTPPTEPEEEITAKPVSPPRLGRTLKHGTRTAWDSLGFVCAASLTLFASLCIPVTLLGLLPGRTVA